MLGLWMDDEAGGEDKISRVSLYCVSELIFVMG